MGFVKDVTIIDFGYQCERCNGVVPAKSEAGKDRPEGYYVHIRRVTERQKHYISDGELYFCCKECLVEGMQYQISSLTEKVEPINRAIAT